MMDAKTKAASPSGRSKNLATQCASQITALALAVKQLAVYSGDGSTAKACDEILDAKVETDDESEES